MGTERTLEAWRIEAISVLARIARAQGMIRLRQDPLLNKVVNIVGTYAIEETLEQPIPAPTDAEAITLRSKVIRLLQDYPLLKAKANAAKPQLTLGLEAPPPPPPPPPPVEVIPTAPPRQYTIHDLADPLFVRKMTKSPAGPKPRDIVSREAVSKILGRQSDAIAAFFAPDKTPESTAVENAHAWTAHLELGESLCLVAGPWKGLPGFVKMLDLVSGDHRQSVLAANLRNGRTRIEVPPSAHEYRFFGGEYDDEIGADLANLRLSGFTTARATAFRVDVTGEGKMLTGAILSPGRTYRILVPPEFDARDIAGESCKNLVGGWSCFEFTLPKPMPQEIEEKLLRQSSTNSFGTISSPSTRPESPAMICPTYHELIHGIVEFYLFIREKVIQASSTFNEVLNDQAISGENNLYVLVLFDRARRPFDFRGQN